MNNRNYFIDYVKGILALLVVLGHVIYTDKILSPSWTITFILTFLFTAGSFYLTRIAQNYKISRKYLLGYKN